MLGSTKGEERFEYLRDYVVFDLETTGLSPVSDKIVEIAGVRVRDGNITEEFSSLVDPQCEIPESAIAVHGITNEAINNAPGLEEALRKFEKFLGDDAIVGQNIVRFDMRFMWRDYPEIFGKTLANDYLDTLKLSRKLLPNLKSHGTSSLCDYYGIDQTGAHRALFDCRMTQEIYENLGKLLA